MYSTK